MTAPSGFRRPAGETGEGFSPGWTPDKPVQLAEVDEQARYSLDDRGPPWLERGVKSFANAPLTD